MEEMILAGLRTLAPLMKREYRQELKGDEMESEIDTEMEFPIDDDCVFKFKIKATMKAKIEYMKLEITNGETKKLGLGDEA